jgi:hypothetical protein
MFKGMLVASMMLAPVTPGGFATEAGGTNQDYEVPASYGKSSDFWGILPGPLGHVQNGFLAGSPESDTCPCVDTFCVGFCDLLLRLVAARLRERADDDFEMAEEPEQLISDRDFLEQRLALTNEEMQEMLESAEFLEADLESLYFGPDEPPDESVLGAEAASVVCPFQYQRRAAERPTELTVARAPRELMLEEGSEMPTALQPASSAGVTLKVSRLLYRSLVGRIGYLPLSALSFVSLGHTPVSPRSAR